MACLGAFRRSARSDSGQTLVLAVVIVAALTVTTAGVITFMGSNETSAGRDRSVVRAVDIAEAGLSNGFSVVIQNDSNNLTYTPNPNNPNAASQTLGPYTANVDGGQVTYSMTKSSRPDVDGNTLYYWTVDSTGSNGQVTRELKQEITYVPGVSHDDSAVYKYGLFIGAPTDGSNPPCLITLHGNVTVTANVYIGGNLCTQGGVSLTPKVAHTLGLFVLGYINSNGSGTFGTSALPFSLAIVKGGCSATNNVVCTSNTNVWADAYGPATLFPTLTKPQVFPQTIYNGAASGWAGKCTGAAGFILDTNAVWNDQSEGTGNAAEELYPNKNYTCTVPKADGTTATLDWNASTNVMTITGSFYIDGDIKMSNSATWKGNGSIYVNGIVTKKSAFNVCGPPGTIKRSATTTNNSTTVTGLSKTSDLQVGGGVSGTGIPGGTTIASITNATTIVMSARASASGTPTLTFTSGPTGFGCSTTWDTSSTQFTGTTTTGSPTITGLADNSTLYVGEYVMGTGIPTGATIASIPGGNTTSVTLSTNATASGTNMLTFQRGNFGLVILNPTSATTAFASTGNGELDMDMYIVKGFANTGGTVVTGSVIADGGDIGGGTGVLNPQNPPPDFPTTDQKPAVGWSASPTSWKEIK